MLDCLGLFRKKTKVEKKKLAQDDSSELKLHKIDGNYRPLSWLEVVQQENSKDETYFKIHFK